jgi:hypothetical protein
LKFRVANITLLLELKKVLFGVGVEMMKDKLELEILMVITEKRKLLKKN